MKLAGLKDPLPWLTGVAGIGGNPLPCRLGRVVMQIVDKKGRKLAPRYIVAKFVTARGQMPEILLGLHGAIFNVNERTLSQQKGRIWLKEDA